MKHTVSWGGDEESAAAGCADCTPFPAGEADDILYSARSWDLSPVDAEETDLPFKDLVQKHNKRLYRFILKNIGHSSDAEDLTQQTFLEAARAYGSYRGESALSTWLYGIAMNLTRNYLSRSPHRKYSFVDEAVLESLPSASQEVTRELINRQAMTALQNELTDLPEEMREVLLLVALEEVSYEEAAVMLSIPLGTVRSRVSRARSRLRQRFDETGIELGF